MKIFFGHIMEEVFSTQVMQKKEEKVFVKCTSPVWNTH